MFAKSIYILAGPSNFSQVLCSWELLRFWLFQFALRCAKKQKNNNKKKKLQSLEKCVLLTSVAVYTTAFVFPETQI